MGYLELLVEMLRDGAQGLGEGFRAAQGRWLEAQQLPDGGFPGRNGPSDAYYTDFALRALEMVAPASPAFTRAAAWLASDRPAPRDLVGAFAELSCHRTLAAHGMSSRQLPAERDYASRAPHGMTTSGVGRTPLSYGGAAPRGDPAGVATRRARRGVQRRASQLPCRPGRSSFTTRWRAGMEFAQQTPKRSPEGFCMEPDTCATQPRRRHFSRLRRSKRPLRTANGVGGPGTPGNPLSQALAAHSLDSGGFSAPGSGGLSAYASFLGTLCRELLGEPTDAARAGAAVRALRRDDGGFAERAGEAHSQTNATAAVVALLVMAGGPSGDEADGVARFLTGMQGDDGGLRAHADAPEGDLLSTFTGLLTLLAVTHEPPIDIPGLGRFVRAVARPGGGFGACPSDTGADVEYAYYGIATLALLRTMAGER